MALPNNDPIYSRSGDIQSGSWLNSGTIIGPTAATTTDGTSNCYPVFQADATNGGYVQKIKFKPVGTPAAATVARIYVCTATGAYTVGTTNTATNTALIEEISLPAWTLVQTSASPMWEIPLNFALPLGHRLLVSFGTSTGTAGNGWSVTTIAGKY